MTYKEFAAAAEAIGVGNPCVCAIEGDEITDAKLQFEREWYICQNGKPGSPCSNKLGYAYSWVVNDAYCSSDIDFLNPLYVSEDNLIPYEHRL